MSDIENKIDGVAGQVQKILDSVGGEFRPASDPTFTGGSTTEPLEGIDETNAQV